MLRRARIKQGGEPHPIIQRGNNRSACFFSEEDYRFYLESVAAGAARYNCAIHAYGRPDDLLREHPCYLDLGKDNRLRQEAYRALFSDHLDSESLATIRAAVNSGLVLGGERFKDQVEAVLSRSVRAGKSGRPKKRRTGPDTLENN